MSHALQTVRMNLGLSSDNRDSLFKFKSSFGRTENNLKCFYIGKAVFNPDVYQTLCSYAKAQGLYNQDYFPQYRG